MLGNQYNYLNQDLPSLIHFSADDVFLFAEATTSKATSIHSILNSFSTFSGLSINGAKSKIYFSPNCPSALCNSISDQLNFTQTKSLGNYLGFPLLTRKPKHSDFSPIIHKISYKLANWKSMLLNMSGHVTLVKSVFSAIPIHLMQCLPFPKKHPTNLINNCIRKFLWGSSDEHRKIHLINWALVTQSKSNGG